MSNDPIYFADATALCEWFSRHADRAQELHVGFVRKATGRGGLTWPQAVDEALCVGWIDGIRHRVDDERYRIRFTPRRPGSHWSAVNITRVAELEAQGRMQPAGRAAFAARSEERSRRASYEQSQEVAFGDDEARLFREHRTAWAFFSECPPGYRRKATWIVMSAKRPETRQRRLLQLIAGCAKGVREWS